MAQSRTILTRNTSSSESSKPFVDSRESIKGYDTGSEYLRDLVRNNQDRARLRKLLLAGAESAPARPADETYFGGLRDGVRRRGS